MTCQKLLFSLFRHRALWPHETLALKLISHVWKARVGKLTNVQAEQVEPQRPKSKWCQQQQRFSSSSSQDPVQHIMSVLYGIAFVTSIYQIHYTIKNMHLHAEQISMKTNWRLAKRLLYNQGCKERSVWCRGRKGREAIRSRPMPLAGDT